MSTVTIAAVEIARFERIDRRASMTKKRRRIGSAP
jgi:hypothetical protein